MKLLPNYEKAIIPREKIFSYALNMEHPIGRNKAIVFQAALGYDASNGERLISAILREIGHFGAEELEAISHGRRYQVDMRLPGANGKYAWVRTAWIVLNEDKTPRLTTLYVLKDRKE